MPLPAAGRAKYIILGSNWNGGVRTDTPVGAGAEHCDERHEMAPAIGAEPGRPVLHQSLGLRPPDTRRLHDAPHLTHLRVRAATQVSQVLWQYIGRQ